MRIRRLASRCAASVAVALLAVGALTATSLPAQALDPAIPLPSVDGRLAGTDRYGTAVAVSKAAFPATAPVVYVASGANFPDALSAGPVAAAKGGPLLLTRPTRLPAEIAAEIGRLQPKKIVIVGSRGAVSGSVEAALKKLGPQVVREGGTDRYATSRRLVERSFPATAPAVYLATGAGFADALSAGAAAAKAGGPVLLVRGNASGLDVGTTALLEKLSPGTITIVGGKNAVSNGILQQAKTLAGTVTRIGGVDRYETSAMIADTWSAAQHAYIASGATFPDALVGSALAGKEGEPLYIIDPVCPPRDAQRSQRGLGITALTVLGGPSVLADDAPTRTDYCMAPATP